MFMADKYYPVQGVNKFQTVSFPITKAFAIDFGAQSSCRTATLFSVPKGSVILGFSYKITEAFETTATSSPVGFTVGFTGTEVLSSIIASGTAVLGYVGGMSTTAVTVPITLLADDTFDITTGTSGAATAGKMDVYLSYIPSPHEDLSTAEFLSYVTT
jgi:hypothetical protein